VQAKEYAMHTGIQLRSDTLIIPQNTGIFAALQQSENGFVNCFENDFSKIMPLRQALLCNARNPFD
jgi:hypothetical protein